ncbi:MAG: hypothetical protein FRX48_09111 [Lasallia pustulata]|uniref:Uncharacterized protein n=1 Tax=Lasallia pustulata TaxID=136370 RepID=A0A5M8PCW4_9LECA|nr:MAG: hypothetical protein FRX48_09111 [Lasallia pustulata]
MELYDDYGHDTIPFLLRSKQVVVEFDPGLIQAYLPGLWELINDDLPRHNAGYLRPEDFGPFQDPTSRRALSYLFDYLEEIQRNGTSAALYNSLQHLWKACKSRSGGHHSRRHLGEITAVFSQLGKIFDTEQFGCNENIFNIMSTFFVEHSAEIMRWGRSSWVDYLVALERMVLQDDDLVPALSCIAQQQKLLRPGELEGLEYYVSPRGQTLDPETVELLFILIGQKRGQDRERDLLGFGPLDPGYRGGGRRGHLVRTGDPHHNGYLRSGTEYGPRELKDLATRHPELIIVQEGLKGRLYHRLRYYGDGFPDSDPEFGYAGDFGRMQLPHRIRRARHDHMIENGGRRRYPMAVDGFDGMDEYIEDFRRKIPGRGVRGRRLEMVRR